MDRPTGNRRHPIVSASSHTASTAAFARARAVIPGGVNTSLRRMDPPIVWSHADGSYLTDVDGNQYLDFHAAFGPILLGHADRSVATAIARQQHEIDLVGVGTTELEIAAAEKVVEHVPSAEQVLFCTSGSEATYHAVRLARAVTGRSKSVKFQGCYHGWHDYLLMNVVSQPHMLGEQDPLSAGSLPSTLNETLVIDFNDVTALEDLMTRHGEDVAGMIFELVPHAIGCVLPEADFLHALRRIATEYESVLIFDEVVTGFRHGLSGYQGIAGVTPDLTTLGKAMANGYPCAALAGRRRLMEQFNTATGDVFFSGTYTAHPLAMAACLATIEQLERPGFYTHLYALGDRMRDGMRELVAQHELDAIPAGFGSIFTTYFMQPPIRNYSDLVRNDAAMYQAFHAGMLDRGFFMLPLNLKRNHLMASHTAEDIDRTLNAADDVLMRLSKSTTPVRQDGDSL